MMLQRKIPTIKNILHSIPIGSIMVLLLLLGFLVSPNIYYSNNSAYAVEEDNVSSSANNTSAHTNDEESSTSLIIGGAEMNEVVDASVGEVAYRKHTVTISASKLKSYTLFISGPEGLNGETAITGANGNTPTDMPKNSWGYAYGQDGNENDMTYNSFTNNAELIDSKLESESTTEDTDFTKNLIFAVKFGNAIAGHYTGTVTLSLAAEPKEVVLPTNPVETWDELQSMQQMTSKACASIGTASTGNYPSKTLVDSRDGNEYTITKLDDQNCWMTTNLKLDLSTTELTSADSNVSTSTAHTWNGGSDTTLASESSGFSNGTESIAKWNNGKNSAGNNWSNYKDIYGYYYNWCAATAGTCVDSGEAKGSICPKGWRLPRRGDIDILSGKDGGWGTKSGVNGRTLAGGFFPATGFVYDGSPSTVDSEGFYWSSTVNGADYAYYLNFSRSSLNTFSHLGRYSGLSVRCIAMNAEDEEQQKQEQETINKTDGFGGIKKLQDMTSDICNQASIPKGTTGQLYDSRDLNIYDVAKLDDGKCWMTQNLKLDISKANSLDSNNTNIATGTTWPSKDLTASGFSNSNTEPVWNNGTGVTAASGSGAYNSSYGYYYNWCAVTAGTCVNSGNASGSICPRGWKLPSLSEYQNFLTKAGIDYKYWNGSNWSGSSSASDSAKIRGAPYNFPYAGIVDNGSLNNVGSFGYYWSSTVDGTGLAYRLFFRSSSSVNTNAYYRYYGLSVRCIAQE